MSQPPSRRELQEAMAQCRPHHAKSWGPRASQARCRAEEPAVTHSEWMAQSDCKKTNLAVSKTKRRIKQSKLRTCWIQPKFIPKIEAFFSRKRQHISEQQGRAWISCWITSKIMIKAPEYHRRLEARLSNGRLTIQGVSTESWHVQNKEVGNHRNLAWLCLKCIQIHFLLFDLSKWAADSTNVQTMNY